MKELKKAFVCDHIHDRIMDEINYHAYNTTINVSAGVSLEDSDWDFNIEVFTKWEVVGYEEWEDGMEFDVTYGGECLGYEINKATYIDDDGNTQYVPQDIIDDFNRKYGE